MTESVEQRARDMLERMSSAIEWSDPQRLTASDVAELANLMAEVGRARRALMSACASCRWNNQCGLDDPCSHCEDGAADQYDKYPFADCSCSGFSATAAEIERLRKELHEAGDGDTL